MMNFKRVVTFFLFLFCMVISQSCKKQNSLAIEIAKLPQVAVLNVSSATLSGNIYASIPFTGTVTLPYTGGNSLSYPADTVIKSTGAVGLSIKLNAGTLTDGAGSVVYTITGAAFSSGTASFPINFGGQSVTLSIPVLRSAIVNTPSFTIIPDSAHTFATRSFIVQPYSGFNYSSAFSWTEDVTTATSVDINYLADVYVYGPAQIIVLVNGVQQQIITSYDDQYLTTTVALPGTGQKTVKIIYGMQQRPFDGGNILGFFITSKVYNQLATPTLASDKTNVALFIGDSISVGVQTSTPATDGLIPWLRAQPAFTDYTIISGGYGYKGIYPTMATPNDQLALAVSDVKRIGDPPGRKEIWLELGTNDFGIEYSTPIQAATALSNYITIVHRLNADIKFKLMTPFIRYDETRRNALGFLISDYRAALAAIQKGRESYVSVIKGENINYQTNSPDGVHPNTIGVSTVLGPALLPQLQ